VGLERKHQVELAGVGLAEHAAALGRGAVDQFEDLAVLPLWLAPRGHAERDGYTGLYRQGAQPAVVLVLALGVAAHVFAGQFENAAAGVTHDADQRRHLVPRGQAGGDRAIVGGLVVERA
jgi:hypothetical protein